MDAQDIYQRTALHHAALNMDGELFRMILLSRANWSLRDKYHKTPFKYVMEAVLSLPFVPIIHRTEYQYDPTLSVMV